MSTRHALRGGFGGVHVLADDDPRWPHDVLRQARAACEGGAAVVQLRCKHSGDREALRLAREIRAMADPARTAFFVNDRFDLALLAEADGVHLGQGDLPPQRLPESARARLAIGRSTHSLAQARRACEEPVDYIAFGPVFGTTSKQSAYDARGAAALAEIVGVVGVLPVVAIGGIEETRCTELADCGARGAAVISAVAAAADPLEATRALVDAFDRALASGARAGHATRETAAPEAPPCDASPSARDSAR